MWDIFGHLPPWAAPTLEQIGAFLLQRPSSTTSLAAVMLVPLAAIGYFAARHAHALQHFRFRRVLAIILSRRYLGHRSHVLDVLLMGGNIGLFALVIGQATVSMTGVAAVTYDGLISIFGVGDPTRFNAVFIGSVWAAALFLAYEFAYWLDHYLSHNIPMLWEFHKVHHTAEVLSPLTNFRVHPVDSLVFMNVIALCNGIVTGILHCVFAAGPVQLEWLNHTTMLSLAVSVFAQLQHTHVWIAFTGVWGRLILSPAHHQIHHSVDGRHHNKNLGNLIAIFDWAFGTLYIPTKTRQKLVFGLNGNTVPLHDLNEGLVQPFTDAARLLATRPARPQQLGNPQPDQQTQSFRISGQVGR